MVKQHLPTDLSRIRTSQATVNLTVFAKGFR